MTVLSNAPQNEVATEAEVSGEVKNPKRAPGVVIKLIQNAFFKAILLDLSEKPNEAEGAEESGIAGYLSRGHQSQDPT